jgi:hypothetical protein
MVMVIRRAGLPGKMNFHPNLQQNKRFRVVAIVINVITSSLKKVRTVLVVAVRCGE